jgi:lysophospholipase L1-like esterase
VVNHFQKNLKYFFALAGILLGCQIITVPSSLAADEIAVRYGLFTQAVSIVDLRHYATTGSASLPLQGFLYFLNQDEQVELRSTLQTQMPVKLVALDQVLNSATGIRFLTQLAQADDRQDEAGVQALRSAVILGIKSNRLSILNALAAYPNPRLTINLPKALAFLNQSTPQPPIDRLPTIPVWQTLVQYQAAASQGESYQGCLFGDSISSGLGNSLGENRFNFAAGGMSTVSLIPQLEALVAKKLHCQTTIIAIVTNDAWYDIDDQQFEQNMIEIITQVRSLRAEHIYILPAFYSTLAASRNPKMAGTIQRVDEINQLLKKVATEQGVPIEDKSLEPLFEQKTLKKSLTGDGIHLNTAGKAIYRKALLQLFDQ